MKRIGLFIDGSNIFMSAKALGFRVDYTKLLNYYKSMGEVAHAFYFTALPPKEVNSDLRKMVDYVRHNGYVVVEKETREYVDDKGSPTGSSFFTSTGDAVVKSQEAGAVRLAMQGTLKQQSKNAYGGLSTTTYRVTVDIEVGGNPLKIRHLKTTTCGAKPCGG